MGPDDPERGIQFRSAQFRSAWRGGERGVRICDKHNTYRRSVNIMLGVNVLSPKRPILRTYVGNLLSLLVPLESMKCLR